MKRTKIMLETAVSVALAVVCSFIKVWEMPQGGSVALTMIPLLVLAFRHGIAVSCTAGAVYGAISLMLSGVVYHPMSILLDYILAFGCLGIAGGFKKSISGIIKGACAGVFGRFICSLISGAVLFGEYAPSGQSPWIYSLVYQATYMIPELIIAILALYVLYKRANKLFR